MKKLLILIIILCILLVSCSETSKKINECRDLCAGNSKIPYVLSVCKSDCSKIYYYGGEEGLNRYIEEMKNE